MALKDEEHQEVKEIAELTVHRYMNHLFDTTLPRIITAALSAHNNDIRAHGGIVARFSRLQWVMVGLAAGAGGGAGVGLMKLLGL